MKLYSSRFHSVILHSIVIFVMIHRNLHAGFDTVTTTPATDAVNNVIVTKDSDVSFQISATPFNGYVSSSGYSWIFNNGTIMAGDPTQAGPIVVTFGSAAEGNDNECTVGLTHYGSGGELCQGPATVVSTVNVIVPKINALTVATTPSNQSRTTVGVGEEVNLSLLPTDLSSDPSVVSPTWSGTGST